MSGSDRDGDFYIGTGSKYIKNIMSIPGYGSRAGPHEGNQFLISNSVVSVNMPNPKNPVASHGSLMASQSNSITVNDHSQGRYHDNANG